MRTSPDVLLALVTALALPVLALASCGGDARPGPHVGVPRPLVPVTPATPATPAPAATPAPLPLAVGDCVHPELRPATITIACGDGGLVLRDLRYDRWDTRTASGRGRELRDDCVPDCASGHEVAEPVRVELDQPAAVEGRRLFTRLTLRSPAGALLLRTPLLPLSCGVAPPSCPPSPPAGG